MKIHLTKEQVKEIYSSDESLFVLTERFDISPEMISRIHFVESRRLLAAQSKPKPKLKRLLSADQLQHAWECLTSGAYS